MRRIYAFGRQPVDCKCDLEERELRMCDDASEKNKNKTVPTKIPSILYKTYSSREREQAKHAFDHSPPPP